MKVEIFPARERGTADFGWLQANFSFSFGSYFNPGRIQFGALRVLNDDTIGAGAGFGTHPHDNMEIVTIPLEGALKHRDSMGNEGVITFGEVQVMSAGTGILHSEMNASPSQVAKTLQIWLVPERQNVEPRYDQRKFSPEQHRNQFVTLVTPQGRQEQNALWIWQNAWFAIGIFDAGTKPEWEIRSKGNGLFVFVIDGKISVDGETLLPRDAAQVTDAGKANFEIHESSTILVIEVPMIN